MHACMFTNTYAYSSTHVEKGAEVLTLSTEIFVELWKFLVCRGLVILIAEYHIIKCENVFLDIKYLACLYPMNDDCQNNYSYL